MRKNISLYGTCWKTGLAILLVAVWMTFPQHLLAFFPEGSSFVKEKRGAHSTKKLPKSFFEETGNFRTPAVKQPSSADLHWMQDKEKKPAGKVTDTMSEPSELLQSTGVVIDARGLNARRAVYPRLVTVDTHFAAYGPSYLNAAIREGALYTSDPERLAERLSIDGIRRPLLIKPIRTADNHKDFVVSEEDGRRLINLHNRTKVLSRGKLVMWID